MRRPPPLAALARFVPHFGRLGRATRWRRTKGRPRVWAHRGDSANHFENTMAAFEAARVAGADGIELDVRFDRDQNVVVFHDGDLVNIQAGDQAARFILVSGKPLNEPVARYGPFVMNTEEEIKEDVRYFV